MLQKFSKENNKYTYISSEHSIPKKNKKYQIPKDMYLPTFYKQDHEKVFKNLLRYGTIAIPALSYSKFASPSQSHNLLKLTFF